jgi:hypothetical protein
MKAYGEEDVVSRAVLLYFLLLGMKLVLYCNKFLTW